MPQLDHEGVGSFLEALFILRGLKLVLPGFHFVSGTLVPLEGGLFGGAPEAASLLSLLNQGRGGGPLREALGNAKLVGKPTYAAKNTV